MLTICSRWGNVELSKRGEQMKPKVIPVIQPTHTQREWLNKEKERMVLLEWIGSGPEREVPRIEYTD